HCLYSRPGPSDSIAPIVVPAGETREVRIRETVPGTYYYWGATSVATPLNQRLGPETQRSGALIVDPQGSSAPTDRVLVMGFWTNSTQPAGNLGSLYRFVINGRSWPNMERLSYQVGDIIRLRVINAGSNVHPMHLHGFYFNVDSRGTEIQDIV